MTAMNCEQLADVAAELALGVLDGRERADALEHLDGCNACRQHVASLSVVTDELLRSIAPSVEPPAGFEDRVLAAMIPTEMPQRRARRFRPLAGLAAAACIALVVVLFTVGRSPQHVFAAEEMRTPAGDVVGWIYIDHDQPADVGMNLPGWAEQIKQYGRNDTTYSLRLTDRSGAEHLQRVSLNDEAQWSSTLDIDLDQIETAALVDDTGRVWCEAQL